MNMMMPEMDDALASYLGNRYFADNWLEPRRALFSGEGDDTESLANLDQLMAMHMPPSPPLLHQKTVLCLCFHRGLTVICQVHAKSDPMGCLK